MYNTSCTNINLFDKLNLLTHNGLVNEMVFDSITVVEQNTKCSFKELNVT